MEFLKKIWKLVRNKYVAVSLFFFVVIVVLSENNLMVVLRQHKEVKQLHAVEAQCRRDMERDSIQANQLKGNLDLVEKFGRETYFLKAADEDVFVITDQQ